MKLDDYDKRLKQAVTTTIPYPLWLDAKKHNLNWNDALIFGIQFKLAEMDYGVYPNNKLQGKIMKLQEMLTAKSEEDKKGEEDEKT